MNKSKKFVVKQASYSIDASNFDHSGIELTAHKKFTSSNLRIIGGDGFRSAFEAIRANAATDFRLDEITIQDGEIVLRYRNAVSGERGRFIPKKTVGLRLEFSAGGQEYAKSCYVLEYEQDCILGKLLRIRMSEEGNTEKCATMLEDGHIIFESRYAMEYMPSLSLFEGNMDEDFV